MPFFKKKFGGSSAAQNSLEPTAREEYSEEATQALWKAIKNMKFMEEEEEEPFLNKKIRPLLKVSSEKPDVNKQDERGDTMLRYAVRKRNVGLVEILLNNGADVKNTNDYGGPILITAINAWAGRCTQYSQPKACQLIGLLVAKGADPNELEGEARKWVKELMPAASKPTRS